jgi:hypothetical protein
MHSSLSKRSNGSYYLFFFGDLRPVPVEPVADPIKKRAGQASIAEESAREWEFFSKEPALELQAERAWGSKGQGNQEGSIRKDTERTPVTHHDGRHRAVPQSLTFVENRRNLQHVD